MLSGDLLETPFEKGMTGLGDAVAAACRYVDVRVAAGTRQMYNGSRFAKAGAI